MGTCYRCGLPATGFTCNSCGFFDPARIRAQENYGKAEIKPPACIFCDRKLTDGFCENTRCGIHERCWTKHGRHETCPRDRKK